MKADFDVEGVLVAKGQPRNLKIGKVAQDFTLVVEKFWGDDRSRRSEDVVDLTTMNEKVMAMLGAANIGDYMEARGRIVAQPFAKRDGSPGVFIRLETYSLATLILRFWGPEALGKREATPTTRSPVQQRSAAPPPKPDEDLPF